MVRDARRRIFTEKRPGGARWALRLLGIALAVAFVALLAYGLTTKAADTSVDDALNRGQAAPAPGFELARLEDGQAGRLAPRWRRAAADGHVDLRELRGTPVVLNFWASWCPPCRAEAPVLERGWRDARRQGVLFVGLDQQDATEDARDFLRQFSITFPQVREPGKEVAQAWGVTGIPETFFISPNGDVVGHVVGAISSDELKAGVAAASRGRPVGVRYGGERRPTR